MEKSMFLNEEEHVLERSEAGGGEASVGCKVL